MMRIGTFCSKFTCLTFTAINLDLPPYLQDLDWCSNSNSALRGIIEPMIDGIALPGEWDGAAKYDAAVDGGDFDIENFYLAMIQAIYSHNSVTADELAAISRSSQYDEPDLAIYFMQPNAVNFNEVETTPHTTARFLDSQPNTWLLLISTPLEKTAEPSGIYLKPEASQAIMSSGF